MKIKPWKIKSGEIKPGMIKTGKIKIMKKTETLNLQRFITIVYLSLMLHISPISADPQQRLIIHFSQPLSSNNQIDLHNQLISQQINDYKLLDHNDNKRWIILFQAPITTRQIDLLIHTLMTKEYVLNAEVDKVLTHQ